MKKFHVTIVILLAFAFAGQCYGETCTFDLGDICKRKKLFGDLYGLRSDLAEHGISLDLRSSQFYQGVTSGGVNTNDAYGGKFDYILKIDGHKLGLWEGFFVTMHAESQFGNSIGGDAGAFALPNTSMLYPLPDYRGTAITGLFFE
jgi:porin